MAGESKPYSAERVQQHIRDRVTIEDRGHETPCWLWQGGINGCGYGTGRPAGCSHGLMHRHPYEAFVGPIPPGLQIDHLCRVRGCCNPAHLEPVTRSENLLRRPSSSRFRDAPARRDKDVCRRGHKLTAENTMIERARGVRRCLECYRRGIRDRLARRAAARKTWGSELQ